MRCYTTWPSCGDVFGGGGPGCFCCVELRRNKSANHISETLSLESQDEQESKTKFMRLVYSASVQTVVRYHMLESYNLAIVFLEKDTSMPAGFPWF